jgi:type II secretory pathway component PulL
MGELIICAAAALLPSLIFGGLLLWHVRGERATVSTLAEEAFRHIASRDARDAAEARALKDYQSEALREQRVEFERHEKELRTGEPPALRDVVRDDTGREYEVF